VTADSMLRGFSIHSQIFLQNILVDKEKPGNFATFTKAIVLLPI
jgi:hypothetical protein